MESDNTNSDSLRKDHEARNLSSLRSQTHQAFLQSIRENPDYSQAQSAQTLSEIHSTIADNTQRFKGSLGTNLLYSSPVGNQAFDQTEIGNETRNIPAIDPLLRSDGQSNSNNKEEMMLDALQVIAATLEPPHHYTDDLHSFIKSFLDKIIGKDRKITSFVTGRTFTFGRRFWNYVILQLHLFYNIFLLYWAFFQTPPLLAFAVGITLSWLRICIEILRDVMHRDDPVFRSRTSKEISITAALSASLGFIIRSKTENGVIDANWWDEWY